jgi:uncharacterized protein with HEPN domain
MPGRRDETLLLDGMIDASERLIEVYSSVRPGLLGADRATSEMLMWNLVVLGEAAKRVRKETRFSFPDVEWTQIAGVRDRIIHHYEGVDWEIVDRVIREDLPPLLPHLREIRDLLRDEFDRGEQSPTP